MGGKNPFLGIAYVVVGGICIVLGVMFTAAHLISPRYDALLNSPVSHLSVMLTCHAFAGNSAITGISLGTTTNQAQQRQLADGHFSVSIDGLSLSFFFPFYISFFHFLSRFLLFIIMPSDAYHVSLVLYPIAFFLLSCFFYYNSRALDNFFFQFEFPTSPPIHVAYIQVYLLSTIHCFLFLKGGIRGRIGVGISILHFSFPPTSNYGSHLIL